MKKQLISLITFLFLVSFSTGCLPRGESHSLDKVFNDARGGYVSYFLEGGVPADVAEQLKRISASLDGYSGINGSNAAIPTASELADNLQSLSTHANYTVRPALAELVNQFRALEASGKKIEIGSPNIKLLSARTYTLLTSELSTTKFKV